MIGSAMKKLAQSHEMSIDHGVAYGSLGGFAATMSEGRDYKQIVFVTKFPEAGSADALQTQINAHNVSREFRVQSLNILPDGISVVFTDTIGTMKKIEAFLDWFLPLLASSGATRVNTCSECGCEVVGGCWKLINGVAYHMHEACAQKVCREIEAEEEARKQSDNGSYIKGTVGALLGSLLGAAAWALVLSLGYVASLVGFLIGWFAEKGYNLFKGKQGRGKVAILIVAVIFGVIVGNLIPDVIDLAQMIADGELPEMTMSDIPLVIAVVFAGDAEYRAAVIANVVTGLLFAGLGVFTLLRQTAKNVSSTKVIDLK